MRWGVKCSSDAAEINKKSSFMRGRPVRGNEAGRDRRKVPKSFLLSFCQRKFFTQEGKYVFTSLRRGKTKKSSFEFKMGKLPISRYTLLLHLAPRS